MVKLLSSFPMTFFSRGSASTFFIMSNLKNEGIVIVIRFFTLSASFTVLNVLWWFVVPKVVTDRKFLHLFISSYLFIFLILCFRSRSSSSLRAKSAMTDDTNIFGSQTVYPQLPTFPTQQLPKSFSSPFSATALYAGTLCVLIGWQGFEIFLWLCSMNVRVFLLDIFFYPLSGPLASFHSLLFHLCKRVFDMSISSGLRGIGVCSSYCITFNQWYKGGFWGVYVQCSVVMFFNVFMSGFNVWWLLLIRWCFSCGEFCGLDYSVLTVTWCLVWMRGLIAWIDWNFRVFV